MAFRSLCVAFDTCSQHQVVCSWLYQAQCELWHNVSHFIALHCMCADGLHFLRTLLWKVHSGRRAKIGCGLSLKYLIFHCF